MAASVLRTVAERCLMADILNDLDANERRAVEFIKRNGYQDLIGGDRTVAIKLNLTLCQRGAPRCADLLGFIPNRQNPTQALICEAKGKDIDHALIQLGNAAAALLAHLIDPKDTNVQLTLMVFTSKSKLFQSPIVGPSPGNGFALGQKGPLGMVELVDARMTKAQKLIPAKPETQELLAPALHFVKRAKSLPIYVYVDPNS